jgi:hypothetical protein
MCRRAIDVLTKAGKFGVLVERLVFETNEAAW